MSEILNAALAHVRAGHSIIPISVDTKQPDWDLLPRMLSREDLDNSNYNGKEAGRWYPYQERLPSEDEVRDWGRRGMQAFAIVGGDVSAGLVCLDFDVARFYESWVEKVGGDAADLCVQKSGRDGGGFHVRFKVTGSHKSSPVAYIADPEKGSGRSSAIDLKSDGAYAVAAPSLHKSGRPYQVIKGDLLRIPVVTRERADRLIQACRDLDEAPVTKQERERILAQAAEADRTRHSGAQNDSGGTSPIGEYNRRVTIAEALRANGYAECGVRWVPPGGRRGLVTIMNGSRAYSHNSDDLLCDGKAHDAFDIFRLYQHGGDFRSAVRAAAELYGVRAQPKQEITLAEAETVWGAPRAMRDYTPTDLGNAELFSDLYGSDYKFVSEWKSWLVWDGKRWRRDGTEEAARQMIALVKKDLLAVAAKIGEDEKRAKYLKHVLASQSAMRINGALQLASKLLSISAVSLDSDGNMLNCQNGTVDLKTGGLRPHRREDLLTKICPVAFDPSATAPTWERFIGRIFQDAEGQTQTEVVQYVQKALGYSLTAEVGEQILFLLNGNGRNGKTTLLDAVKFVLGDYAMTAQQSLLLQLGNAGAFKSNTEDEAALAGVRFVSCSETDEGQRLDESKVKRLVGGGQITAMRKYEHPFTFEPTHKIWLDCNHLPRVRGADDGIWRRIKRVPFVVQIPPAERDPKLGDKLREEGAGVLRWMLDGLHRWRMEGLSEPEVVVSAVNAYRGDSDVFGTFLRDAVVNNDAETVLASTLYQHYRSWCTQEGLDHPLSQIEFGKRMRERGYTNALVGQHRARCWRGMELIDVDKAVVEERIW